MKATIGFIGLAGMGENPVLNRKSRGFKVAVFNRTVEKGDKPRGEFFHSNWTGRGGDAAAAAYIV